MIKIILFSDNKDNIEKISVLLKLDHNFSVTVRGYDRSSGSGPLPDDITMIILDLTCPGTGSGTEGRIEKIPAELLKSKTAKILILNHDQQELFSRKTFFVDDFLFTRNISSEILPRIYFLLNRVRIEVTGNCLVAEGLILNLDKYELSVDGEVIVLTFKEFEMLKILMQNKNKVFTRINLLSSVWGYDYYGGSRTVDVHMRRLRSKIPSPYSDMLKTVRNVGYMFLTEE
jgi:DNA-binding response OmpR family regulator